MFSSVWTRKPNFKAVSFENYNAYWEHRGWHINSKLKQREVIMLELIPDGAHVADVGCGNSRLPIALKEKNCRVDVGDISDKVLSGYKEYGLKGFKIDLENITNLDLPQKYDYIIMSEVLEHLRYPEKSLSILMSYTERFVITVPNTAAHFYRIGLAIKGRFPAQWTYHPSEHLRYWSHLDFLDWLDAQGLVVEKQVAADGATLGGLLPFLPQLWKNLFAHRVVYVCRVPQKTNSD